MLKCSSLPVDSLSTCGLKLCFTQSGCRIGQQYGKTLYEMVRGVKPYLGGLQEFGVAMYVKDLTAGKLDPCVTKGRFMGYDTESKGYWIYWPDKKSVSIEQNVIFNPEDLLTMLW